MRSFLFIMSLLCIIISCNKDDSGNSSSSMDLDNPNFYSQIEPSNQRQGNINLGEEYLKNGEYVGSGIPLDLFQTLQGADSRNLLERSGINATIPHGFTAVKHSNGTDVVAPNCMQCHSGFIGGEYVLGLGNAFGDFTINQGGNISLIDNFVQSTYGTNSLEWEAYLPFSTATHATGNELVTETIGSNPANKLALILSLHRNPETLEWNDVPTDPIPDDLIPSDIPPWWLLKKKNAMFYTATGRGDFARISMASSLLTMENSDEAGEIDTHFPDVMEFINSLEPPVYPNETQTTMVESGKQLFEENCSRCHGTYGEEESYPNLIVHHDLINTDRMLLDAYFQSSDFIEWYNSSWFGIGPSAAEFIASDGYIAPPLDGIWATAPYLHNGSVPDLLSLLNSEQRPTIWKHPSNSNDYNFTTVGWNYEERAQKVDKFDYDTQIPGYGNQGHIFGDHLSEQERMDVIEYLKTI